MKALFATLSARLMAEVSDLKRVQRWNNQVSRESGERALAVPCVYLELLPAKAATQTRDVQHCDGLMRVRLVCKSSGGDTNLDLQEEVYRALQHFRADPLLVPMDRRGIFQDTNTDILEQLVQDFAVKWVDTSKQTPTAAASPKLALEV